MEIHCATDEIFGINTYFISENGYSFIIDPVLTPKLMTLLKRCVVDFAIVTHEHYDHIYGVNSIKQMGIKVLCGKKAEAGLMNPSKNLSKYADLLNEFIPFGNHTAKSVNYMCSADGTLRDGEEIQWQGHLLLIKETPGHSAGSISVLLDRKYLFCGDAIFKEYETATRMPGGNTKDFKNVTEPWLDSLTQELLVYPGHTEPFILKERLMSKC